MRVLLYSRQGLRQTWLALCALVVVSACAQVKPPPDISAVEPNRVARGVDTQVTIRGDHFFGELMRGDDGTYTEDLTFQVRLPGPGMELAVTFGDTRTLTATLPASLAVGSYDVVVETPGGDQVTAPDAFSVVDVALTIEDAADGTGSEVGDAQIGITGTIDLFAVTRSVDDDAFVSDVDVAWTATGTAATLDADSGPQVTVTGMTAGTTVVTATHPLFGSDDTGTIDISETIAVCGDTMCEGDEDSCTCAEDCGQMCGDTCCNGTENATTCPGDCDCATCTMGSCKETCTGDCTLECDSPCECLLDCAETTGTCVANCAGQDVCSIDCADANNCQPSCSGNAECVVVNCSGSNNCEGVCEGNAECNFDCTNANSCDQIRCNGNAKCLLDCTGANNCSYVSCNGTETMCPGNIIACNRACP